MKTSFSGGSEMWRRRRRGWSGPGGGRGNTSARNTNPEWKFVRGGVGKLYYFCIMCHPDLLTLQINQRVTQRSLARPTQILRAHLTEMGNKALQTTDFFFLYMKTKKTINIPASSYQLGLDLFFFFTWLYRKCIVHVSALQ